MAQYTSGLAVIASNNVTSQAVPVGLVPFADLVTSDSQH